MGPSQPVTEGSVAVPFERKVSSAGDWRREWGAGVMHSYAGRLAATVMVVAGGVCGSANAAQMSAQDALQQFNLIVFEDLESNSEVEGRTIVYGDVKGQNTSNFFIKGDQIAAPGNPYDGALYVGGSITVQNGINVNNGGDVYVGGDARGVNLNGHGNLDYVGTYSGNFNQGTRQQVASVDIPETEAALRALSVSLADVAGPAQPTLTGDSINRGAKFDAMPDFTGMTVYDITSAELASFSQGIDFELNGASAVVINVSGTDVSMRWNSVNWDGFEAARILWNFHEATTLGVAAQLVGTVLAPNAHVTMSSPIEGTLVARSVKMQAEVHTHPYVGALPPIGVETPPSPPAVPVPAALPLMGAALAGFGWLRMRRRV